MPMLTLTTRLCPSIRNGLVISVVVWWAIATAWSRSENSPGYGRLMLLVTEFAGEKQGQAEHDRSEIDAY